MLLCEVRASDIFAGRPILDRLGQNTKTQGRPIEINTSFGCTNRLGISDQQIIAPIGFLADVDDAFFVVLLHVQLGFVRCDQYRGFVGGHDHLIARVGLGCRLDRFRQTIRSHLLECFRHLIEGTINVKRLNCGQKSSGDGFAKLFRGLGMRDAPGKPEGDQSKYEKLKALHGVLLLIHMSERQDSNRDTVI